jgi:CBS-domain-containing membrane protein
MASERRSLEPIRGADRVNRRRLNLRGEFLLALLPTLIVLAVLALLEVFSRQRLLFASLASSAFLIYLDPEHGTNTTRCLVLAHVIASLAGMLIYLVLGAGYVSGGAAMIATITAMILLDVVHPPAVATALSFAFRDESAKTLLLFIMALGMIAVLVVMQRAAVWLVARLGITTR